MCKESHFTVFVFIFLFSFTAIQSSAQDKTEETQHAIWIFNISYGITWENEANITTYTIGVFSSPKLFTELQKLAETKKIKGKPVNIVRYSNFKDIQANQIVCVSKDENAYLGSVYKELKGKNVLIISDCSKQPEYSIINFRKTGDKNPFDINDRLADQNKITISRQLLKIGGSREAIQKIYAEKNRDFLNLQKKLEKAHKEMDSVKQINKVLTAKIIEQEKIIEELKRDSDKK